MFWRSHGKYSEKYPVLAPNTDLSERDNRTHTTSTGCQAEEAGVPWSFAEKCEKARSVEDIQAIFSREIRARGFSHWACTSHVDPLNPPNGAVMMFDYPRPWVEHFSAQGYARRDPVFLTARRQALPFQWSDRVFRRGLDAGQAAILNEANEAGIGDGFTIPIHAPDALPASCSLVIGPDGVDPLHVREAHWFAVFAHERARRLLLDLTPPKKPVLSRRERQCLELIAQGKDDFAVSVILGISEHTAHNTVRRAMQKYGVATRVQAFVRALSDGEIKLEDVAS
ncbi:MAG: LuxR family transcriptional regulator [Hyphomonadaceae bacterium]|nr:LuxR family transcriptional regulator [Hyphomonadaceae bacterium]